MEKIGRLIFPQSDINGAPTYYGLRLVEDYLRTDTSEDI